MLVALYNLGLGPDMGQVMAVGYEKIGENKYEYLWRKIMDVEEFLDKYDEHQLIKISRQPKISNPNEWILAIHFYSAWSSLKAYPEGR